MTLVTFETCVRASADLTAYHFEIRECEHVFFLFHVIAWLIIETDGKHRARGEAVCCKPFIYICTVVRVYSDKFACTTFGRSTNFAKTYFHLKFSNIFIGHLVI